MTVDGLSLCFRPSRGLFPLPCFASAAMSSPAEPQMRPARSIIDLLNPISIDIPPAPKVQRQPEVKPRYTHPSRDAHYGLARATPTASMRTSASSVAGPSHQDQALPRVHQHIVGSLYENDMASALPWLVEPTSYPPISPMYSDERTGMCTAISCYASLTPCQPYQATHPVRINAPTLFLPDLFLQANNSTPVPTSPEALRK